MIFKAIRSFFGFINIASFDVKQKKVDWIVIYCHRKMFLIDLCLKLYANSSFQERKDKREISGNHGNSFPRETFRKNYG